MSEFVSTQYVVDRLGCSLSHANWLCRHGKIKASKPFGTWLVDKKAFDAQTGAISDDAAENIDI